MIPCFEPLSAVDEIDELRQRLQDSEERCRGLQDALLAAQDEQIGRALRLQSRGTSPVESDLVRASVCCGTELTELVDEEMQTESVLCSHASSGSTILAQIAVAVQTDEEEKPTLVDTDSTISAVLGESPAADMLTMNDSVETADSELHTLETDDTEAADTEAAETKTVEMVVMMDDSQTSGSSDSARASPESITSASSAATNSLIELISAAAASEGDAAESCEEESMSRALVALSIDVPSAEDAQTSSIHSVAEREPVLQAQEAVCQQPHMPPDSTAESVGTRASEAELSVVSTAMLEHTSRQSTVDHSSGKPVVKQKRKSESAALNDRQAAVHTLVTNVLYLGQRAVVLAAAAQARADAGPIKSGEQQVVEQTCASEVQALLMSLQRACAELRHSLSHSAAEQSSTCTAAAAAEEKCDEVPSDPATAYTQAVRDLWFVGDVSRGSALVSSTMSIAYQIDTPSAVSQRDPRNKHFSFDEVHRADVGPVFITRWHSQCCRSPATPRCSSASAPAPSPAQSLEILCIISFIFAINYRYNK